MNTDRLIGIAGAALGVVGIGLSVVFYLVGERSREPVLLVERTRAQIVNRDDLAQNRLRVFARDSVEILENVSTATFYVWNAGEIPIRRDDILDSIVISVDGKNCDILNYRLVSVSRKVCGATLTRIDSTHILIGFDVLEQNDGIKCQVTVASNYDWQLKWNGHIIECGESPRTPVTNAMIWKKWWMGPLGFTTNMGVWAFLWVLYNFSVSIHYSEPFRDNEKWLEDVFPGKSREERGRLLARRRVIWWIGMVFVAGVVLFLSAFFGLDSANEALEGNLSALIPESLR